ncbi:MAG TPA: PspC domain-containing protein [Candidatus Cryosericum sp.]|nr:PspC domain-containing protein [Candidatus Cryosericum sp.]
MKSFEKPDEEAVAVCTVCGKALAREEVVMVDGKVRCSSCATADQKATSCETKEDARQGEPQHSGTSKPKRLYRSHNQIIGGVAAGLAEYLGIDPTIVRIAWALLGIAWGTGVLLYLICWLVIPLEPTT